jgi:hypothetical protein
MGGEAESVEAAGAGANACGRHKQVLVMMIWPCSALARTPQALKRCGKSGAAALMRPARYLWLMALLAVVTLLARPSARCAAACQPAGPAAMRRCATSG